MLHAFKKRDQFDVSPSTSSAEPAESVRVLRRVSDKDDKFAVADTASDVSFAFIGSYVSYTSSAFIPWLDELPMSSSMQLLSLRIIRFLLWYFIYLDVLMRCLYMTSFRRIRVCGPYKILLSRISLWKFVGFYFHAPKLQTSVNRWNI